MRSASQPIYLFADSQLLFWKHSPLAALDRIHRHLDGRVPTAAYIGASNGDAPEFYDLFQAAMQSIGVEHCKHVLGSFAAGDRDFLQRADIILLAGGDVRTGWDVICSTGMRELILQRHRDGATLIGISAGAMQLGAYGLIQEQQSSVALIDTFKLVPCIIDVHDEKTEWRSLANIVRLMEGSTKGLGIPSGGGVIYHPDRSLECMRRPATELVCTQGKVTTTLLYPPTA